MTIEYKDAQGSAQSVVFEIGKDAIRPLLSSLETRTGKTVVDQPDPTKTNNQILSIWDASDAIVYGRSLLAYVEKEVLRDR